MQYCLNITILVQDFCALKIKITQFSDGFHLKKGPTTNNGSIWYNKTGRVPTCNKKQKNTCMLQGINFGLSSFIHAKQ